MKKILVIGCSHTAGAYNNRDEIISNESWVWHLQKIRNTDDCYYVVHNPGLGIIHYGTIIKYLKEEKLLQYFNSCIIQMTSEMRMMFHKKTFDNYFYSLKNWLLNVDNKKFNQHPNFEYFNEKYRTFSYYNSDVYETYESKFNSTASKTAWLDVSQTILEGMRETYVIDSMYDIYYSYIINTLNAHNIEPIVFDWWGKIQNHHLNKGTEWILNSVMDAAKDRGTWLSDCITPVGQHHNSKSAKLMAEIINEAINKNGKLQ